MCIAICLTSVMAGCAAGPSEVRQPEYARAGIFHLNKGAAFFNKGCYAQAMYHFQVAHQHYSATDDSAGVAHSLNDMANIYYRLGDMASALLLYDDALEAYRTAGDRPGLIGASIDKAAAMLALDRTAEAAALLDQADSLAARDDALAAQRLKTRALLQLREDALPQAGDLLARALAATGPADASVQSSIHFALGHVRLLQNDTGRARASFAEALTIDRAAGAHPAIARDLAAMGTCYALEGEHRQAVNYYKRSAKIYALLRDIDNLDRVLLDLEISAEQADLDIQATLYWVENWRASNTSAVFCD